MRLQNLQEKTPLRPTDSTSSDRNAATTDCCGADTDQNCCIRKESLQDISQTTSQATLYCTYLLCCNNRSAPQSCSLSFAATYICCSLLVGCPTGTACTIRHCIPDGAWWTWNSCGLFKEACYGSSHGNTESRQKSFRVLQECACCSKEPILTAYSQNGYDQALEIFEKLSQPPSMTMA